MIQLSPPPADSLARRIAPVRVPASAHDAVGLITAKLDAWVAGVIRALPNIVVALLVAAAFWALARLARDVMSRALRRTPLPPPIQHLAAVVVEFAVLVVGLFFALGVIGLDKTVTSLLAGVGIVGLALGFAFQDIASNFIAGIFLSFSRPFSIGHIIDSSGFTGVVERITLRTTVLRTFSGQLVLLPNRDVFTKPLTNYSATGRRRVEIQVGISYGDDLGRARDAAVAAVAALSCRDRDLPAELYYDQFGDSAITGTVLFWVDFARQPDYLAARSEAVVAIKRALDEAGITIPFPIRTLDFGIKGGESLTSALLPVTGARGAAGERSGRGASGAPPD